MASRPLPIHAPFQSLHFYYPSLPESGSILNFQFYSEFAVEIGQRPIYYPARINLRVSARSAQRQVKAINRLCDTEFPLPTWKEVALNLRAGQRKETNPLASHGVPKDQIQAAIDRVLSCPGHEWSDGQKTCIRAIQKFHDGLLLIQGFPGTGKTLTLAPTTDIFVSLGIHVLFTTPTHYAADAACLAAGKWAHLSKTELWPLRVYRPASESRAFRDRGKDKRLQQDNGDPELDTQDQHTDCYPVIGLEHTQGQSNKLNPQDTSLADQLFMTKLVAAMKVGHSQKGYGLPAKSLESRVFELAFNSDRKLLDRYPSEEQVAKARGDLYDLIEGGLLDPEGPEEDMIAEVRRFVGLLETKCFRDFEQNEKRLSLLAFKKVSQLVVCEATFLVSTNNNVADGLISTHFGANTNAIVVIRDEDSKETEANSWIPVTNLVNVSKIIGVVRCGDERQLRPTALSRRDKVLYNEFSAQMNVSFPARMIRMNHPVIKLDEQFPYEGQLRSRQPSLCGPGDL